MSEAETKTPRNIQGQVPYDLAARVRGTVRGMQRSVDPDFTLSQLIREATEAYCHQMEQEHNGGEPWTPMPKAGLRRGARLAAEE